MIFERICINYVNNCNMNCPYCFRLTNDEKPIFKKTCELLEKCKDLNIKVVSFSGGEPLMYKKIYEIINYAATLGFEIQIDTNSYLLNEDIIAKLKNSLSLIGVPLDGSKADVHDFMRNKPGNFELIVKKLKYLNRSNMPVKINTVVSKINAHDILNMINIIDHFKIKIWSLYQFWPLNLSNKIEKLYSISKNEFLNICKSIKLSKLKCVIEVNPYENRFKTSIFSSPNGLIYIHDPKNFRKYINIGSIFEDDLQNIFKKNHINKTIRVEARKRYKSLNKIKS